VLDVLIFRALQFVVLNLAVAARPRHAPDLSYRNNAFRDARLAVVILGRTLRLSATTTSYFDKQFKEAIAQGTTVPELEEAIPLLQAGIVAAARIGLDAQIVELLPQAEPLGFDVLKELVCHSSFRKK
jgi:hypothetical protein